MKWTLLWLYVTLASVTPLEITNHNIMPTVFVQRSTPLAPNFGNGVGGHDDNLSEDKGSITKEAVKGYTEETPVGDGSDDNDGIANHLIVNTTYGLVQGIRETSGNTISYFDIPYGRFRNKFEAPTAPEYWTNTLENYNHTVKCPQLDGDTYKGDTNCLTLSVFTRPNIVNASVLFYIHESDFSTGSGDPSIYNPEGLVNRNVILVLPNYRLGPLGFLCLRNRTAPGNAALKDLTLALVWTRNNIREFGGDPSNIAVSGEGTSAALAGYLALSPKSRKFISKVITDSGTTLCHWAIDRNPIGSAVKLAEFIRNYTTEMTHNEDLFKELDVEKLIESSKGTQLKPCIERSVKRSFITVTPWKILNSETINISFIIGTANHAGLLEALKHDVDSISELNEHFTNFLPNDLKFRCKSEMNDVGLALRKQYFGIGNISSEHSRELSLYHTDASYLGPSLRMARALVNAGARVFLYEFSFVGALNKKLMSLEDPPDYGAIRGDIVGYLFPATFEKNPLILRDVQTNQSKEETAEERIVNMMSDLWISFLETGVPSSEGIEWRPLNATSDVIEDYLSIGNETSPDNGIHPNRLRLWTEIYRVHFVDKNAGIGIASGNCVVAFAIVLLGISKVCVG